MLKDKDRAAYFEWCSYWISKVPASRDVIETLPGAREKHYKISME
jgi:hypothetical protein